MSGNIPLVVLLDEIETAVRRYVVMSHQQVTAVALWVVFTWAVDAFDVTPYLAVSSAEKRSGKTRLFDVLSLLVARPWRVVTPSEAVTFRKIDRDHPTLLLDEVDTVFKPGAGEHEGLRALLNAGNRRGTTVPRCVGQSQNLKDFDTFCAKALAGIGRLPDTVADRAVPIRLKRRNLGEPVERFRPRHAAPSLRILQDRLAEWAQVAMEQLREAPEPAMPEGLNDRAEEAWEPLLVLADAAGAHWPARARAAAVALSAADDDDSARVRLLADIRSVWLEQGDPERIATGALLSALYDLEESPWSDWAGKPLTAEKLGRMLREYGVHSRKLRFGEQTARGYLDRDLTDAWSRYLPGNADSTWNTRNNRDGCAENSDFQPGTSGPMFQVGNGPQARMVEPMFQVFQVGTPGTGRAGVWQRLVLALALRCDNGLMTDAQLQNVWALALPLADPPADLVALNALVEQVEAGNHDQEGPA